MIFTPSTLSHLENGPLGSSKGFFNWLFYTIRLPENSLPSDSICYSSFNFRFILLVKCTRHSNRLVRPFCFMAIMGGYYVNVPAGLPKKKAIGAPVIKLILFFFFVNVEQNKKGNTDFFFSFFKRVFSFFFFSK